VIANSTLLNRPEAAERLRQSVRNIDKLIASGELPSVRIGRSVFVRESAIEYFIEARESRVKVKVNRKVRAAIEGRIA
jgi:excisionase family DNA binding protein